MSDEIGLFEAMYSCRAMRRLKTDPVPEELLLKLCDAGNQGPTGSNMQQLRWLIVRDPAVKQQIADLNRQRIDEYIVPQLGSGQGLPHQAPEKRERMLQAVMWQAEHFHEMPALIIPCAPLSPSGARGAGGSSVWPGVQNLLLAARALGLGAALTSLAVTHLEPSQKALGLPADIDPYAVIPVGYPMGRFGPTTRMPVAETVRWDRWE